MSCDCSGHITKLKQSIFAFRYLWIQLMKYWTRLNVFPKDEQLTTLITSFACYTYELDTALMQRPYF
jgi:hypothetical protein